MGYLLSQILISLLFASIVGGAVGWILHGYKAHQREQRLRDSLDRQGMALQQAQSERQMIADDFDELKMNLEGRIADLQMETREIPKLEENLEKSQTLVRQMMQKHDSEIMELEGSNQKLAEAVETHKLRERNHEAEIIALKKVRDEQLDSQRFENLQSSDAGETRHYSQENDQQHNSSNSSIAAGSTIASSVANSMSQREAEVEEARQTSIDLREAGESYDTSDTSEFDNNFASEQNFVVDQLKADQLSEDDLDELTEFEADTYNELQLLEEESDYEAELQSADEDLEEEALDAGYKQMFYTDSETVDDLKSIHGIGPVIEQSLNDIGITSYQQIAELTRNQIQEIADILEIFPGRIERDNWIGSARKLVKEELEEA